VVDYVKGLEKENRSLESEMDTYFGIQQQEQFLQVFA
jgi:hypothetical protein